MLRGNRKGSLLDWFWIVTALFITGVVVILSLFIINKITDVAIFTDNADSAAALAHSKDTLLSMDNLFLFIVVGLSLFTVCSAAMVWNHPAFFFVGLILLAIAIMFAAFMSNAYEDVTEADTMQETAASFPKMNFVMGKLPYYICFMGMLTAVVMYLSYTYGT